MKHPETEKLKRRAFIKGAALTGAAVGAGAATTRVMADESPDRPEPPTQKGYRETDHIRDYYRLARF